MRLGLLALGTLVALGACTQAMAQAQAGPPAVENKRQTKIGFSFDTVADPLRDLASAIADGKPLRTFSGITLARSPRHAPPPIGLMPAKLLSRRNRRHHVPVQPLVLF